MPFKNQTQCEHGEKGVAFAEQVAQIKERIRQANARQIQNNHDKIRQERRGMKQRVQDAAQGNLSVSAAGRGCHRVRKTSAIRIVSGVIHAQSRNHRGRQKAQHKRQNKIADVLTWRIENVQRAQPAFLADGRERTGEQQHTVHTKTEQQGEQQGNINGKRAKTGDQGGRHRDIDDDFHQNLAVLLL